MNKKRIWTFSAVALLPCVLLFTTFFYYSMTAESSLMEYLKNEEGNITEVFHMNGESFEKGDFTKVNFTKVKDLYDYRRYLFIMPNSHFINYSAGEAETLGKSFPKSCNMIYSNQPGWIMEMPWIADLFRVRAVHKCKKIAIKL